MVAAVTAGGAALALSASVARRPWRQRGAVAGSAAATCSGRREELAVPAVGVLRGAARAAKLGAACALAAASEASVLAATRAASPDNVTTSRSQMESPPRLTKGRGRQ